MKKHNKRIPTYSDAARLCGLIELLRVINPRLSRKKAARMIACKLPPNCEAELIELLGCKILKKFGVKI
jgi:hypothetical protein